MRKLRCISRLISIALIIFLMLGLSTACSLFDASPGRSSDSGRDSGGATEGSEPEQSFEGITIEFEPEAVPLTRTPSVPNFEMPEASGKRVESNSKAAIDYSNVADGYIMVKWLAKTTNNLFVQITGPDDVRYQYSILPNGNFEVFPLSGGNGKYTINVLEQMSDGRGARALGLNVNVTLADEFAPFLRPNQFVNFNKDSNVVKKASELVSANQSFTEKITAVYSFVIRNITYDTKLAQAIINGEISTYVPDLDAVLASGKGICFDYAAVMAAMLRSQGIPTKLVFGYADDVFHAWINVYSRETGWVDQVIFFDGKNWTMMDPTFAAAASNPASLSSMIGDGNKYVAMKLY